MIWFAFVELNAEIVTGTSPAPTVPTPPKRPNPEPEPTQPAEHCERAVAVESPATVDGLHLPMAPGLNLMSVSKSTCTRFDDGGTRQPRSFGGVESGVTRQLSGSAESRAASVVCRLAFFHCRLLVLSVLVQVVAAGPSTGQTSALVS